MHVMSPLMYMHTFLPLAVCARLTVRQWSTAPRLLLIYPVPPPPPGLWCGCHYCSETPLRGLQCCLPLRALELIHRLLVVFKHSLNVLIVLDWGGTAELLTFIFSSYLSVGNADFMAAGLKPSLITQIHCILNNVVMVVDFICAFFMCVQQDAVFRGVFSTLNTPRQTGFLSLLTILERVTVNGGLKSKCIIIFPSEYFLSASLCPSACKTGCLSIVFPCVARQPCACTLKWGWKREGKHWVNGDRRSHALLHVIEHTSAPDEWVGQYHCDWLLILIVGLKVHSCTQQESMWMFVKFVFLLRQKMNVNVFDRFFSSKTVLKGGSCKEKQEGVLILQNAYVYVLYVVQYIQWNLFYTLYNYNDLCYCLFWYCLLLHRNILLQSGFWPFFDTRADPSNRYPLAVYDSLWKWWCKDDPQLNFTQGQRVRETLGMLAGHAPLSPR